MAWLRSGDNAATHPIVMRVLSFVHGLVDQVLERDVAVNEVFGFVMRCALQSAGHTTDYVIDEGTAFMVGGVRTERLLTLACKAGYLKRSRRGGVRVFLLIDEPEFIHMRTKAELDRDRQRKHDNANKALIVPVRLRDGDECRYCGVVVNWRDRKSARGGTYDHRNGLGEPATIGTLVVACNGCNASRGDDPAADDRHPLRPAPASPFYSVTTAAFLLDNGHRVTVTDDPQRPGRQPGHAHRDPAASGITHQPPTRRAPVTMQAPNHGAHAPPRSADIEHPESGFAGSGRDGSGSASSSPAVSADVPAARRRRKRSSRGRTPAQRNGDR